MNRVFWQISCIYCCTCCPITHQVVPGELYVLHLGRRSVMRGVRTPAAAPHSPARNEAWFSPLDLGRPPFFFHTSYHNQGSQMLSSISFGNFSHLAMWRRCQEDEGRKRPCDGSFPLFREIYVLTFSAYLLYIPVFFFSLFSCSSLDLSGKKVVYYFSFPDFLRIVECRGSMRARPRTRYNSSIQNVPAAWRWWSDNAWFKTCAANFGRYFSAK
jgi:hypothetical protein